MMVNGTVYLYKKDTYDYDGYIGSNPPVIKHGQMGHPTIRRFCSLGTSTN